MLRDACDALGFNYIFKASYDKANRTSASSPRGPGLRDGLHALDRVRDALSVPVTTDVHLPEQASDVAKVVDLLQIPAFLCRQTDLVEAVAQAAVEESRAVNIKKGQFLSPEEMAGPVDKAQRTGCTDVLVTERGTFFGYHRLVNDFAGLGDLADLDVAGGAPPVCFDCTHSTQRPGASETSGGRPERAPLLAKAAVAAGVDALFLECHPNPSAALSDAASMLSLEAALSLLPQLGAIRSSLAPVHAGHGSVDRKTAPLMGATPTRAPA